MAATHQSDEAIIAGNRDSGRSTTPEKRLKRLNLAIFRARLALAWERVWPRLVPVLSVAGLYVALSWLGLWRFVSDPVRIGLLVAFAIALAAALVRLARLALPGEAEAVRRVEQVSALQHRPASGLRDTMSPVAEDAGAVALWTAHRKRLLAEISGLRAGMPKPDLIRSDGNGLRFAVPVLLAVAAFVASGEHLLRLGEAFTTVPARVAAAAGARIDAWIDPPAYTRQAPVFLSRRSETGEATKVSVPEDSVLTVRVVSEGPAEIIVETAAGSRAIEPSGPAAAEPAASDAIRTYRAALTSPATIAVRHGGTEARYVVDVIEDRPPTVTRGEVTVNRAGSFNMEFDVADDYGVTGGSVTFSPNNPPDPKARPLVETPSVKLRLSRPGRSVRQDTARAFVRLDDHPFAGLEVTADTLVTDAAEQEGRPADDGAMTLPARRFFNPLARALVEQRQILALDANRQHHVAQALDALTIAPEQFLKDASIFLGLRIGYRRLIKASTDDDLRDMLDYLWTMARVIEDGALSDAEERLNAAREALQEALDNGASEEEIARLTQELRQAMQEFLQSLTEQMARQGNDLPQMMPNMDGQMLSQRDLDRMLDRIEDLAKLGDLDAARQLLSELQSLLDNLQMAQRGMRMQNGDAGQMMEQLEELGRLMREQQQLMDDTFSTDQGQRPRQRDGQRQQGQQGPLSPSELAEILRQLQQGQSDLHAGLQELMEQLRQGQQGGQQPGQQGQHPGQQMGQGDGMRALGRAGRALGNATRSHGEGETSNAYGQQGEAMEAMREGLEGMMQQMFGQQGQQQTAGRGPNRDQRDPLGRPQRTQGPDLGNTVQVPDEIDVERARRILNAIRERLGERFRPRFELDYLERLLQPQ
ncbi:MAG TPA: TIGR02302 family protein [Afifellaceae bacterium]|nr:TIGR02302 family protein [Afifellaceae bacterium]